MFKKSLVYIFAITLLVGCKEEAKTDASTVSMSSEFNTLLDNYYEDGLKLNPIQATFAGDNRYNDQFPNPLAPENIAKAKAHFKSYKDSLAGFPEANLTETERMTKEILLWECNMALEGMNFKKPEYMPIDQMWSLNLGAGQLASGAGAQPFKTVEDYQNWMQRLNGYIDWLASAEANMRKGMTEGYVLPKSLIVNVLPQLEAMTISDLDKHLFTAPIRNFPEDFTEEEKSSLTSDYKRLVSSRIIPAYKSLHDFMANEYLESGRESSGIDALPNGSDYYNYQIKLISLYRRA